jgi:hypothetical protein
MTDSRFRLGFLGTLKGEMERQNPPGPSPKKPGGFVVVDGALTGLGARTLLQVPFSPTLVLGNELRKILVGMRAASTGLSSLRTAKKNQSDLDRPRDSCWSSLFRIRDSGTPLERRIRTAR